jgi:dolichol-phosphate mannosyltransferase
MAENIIDELVSRVIKEVSKITSDFEIILVDDCGPDKSWEAIQDQCKQFPFVRGIRLSRNFGQHYAVSAGVASAKGENIILMDCDLQDDPKDIVKLIHKKNEGYEIVFTKRLKRKHSLIKSFTSFLYNKLFAIFSERSYDVDAGSLVLFTSRVAKEFNKLEDRDRLYLQMLKWLGFRSTIIEVEHKERFSGKSNYNFKSLLKLGIQGWTSHSDKLLKFSIYLGFLLSIVSFLAAIIVIIRYLFYNLQPGWPSIIVTMLFSTGLILLSIGIVGIYIGKIFEQSKNRPIYIIDKEINFHE